MQFTTFIASVIAATASTVVAAPAEAAQLEARAVNNMMVKGCTWTIEVGPDILASMQSRT